MGAEILGQGQRFPMDIINAGAVVLVLAFVGSVAVVTLVHGGPLQPLAAGSHAGGSARGDGGVPIPHLQPSNASRPVSRANMTTQVPNPLQPIHQVPAPTASWGHGTRPVEQKAAPSGDGHVARHRAHHHHRDD